MQPGYAELHALSNFTFLRGASHPEELVTTAAALGYRALALTDECSVAGIVHWVHTPWPRSVFPALEAIAEVPFETAPGEDAVQWSLLPQVRIGISKRGHVALNVGAEFPLNERDRYDWRAYVYLIWDFADGGFFEAW